MQTHQNRLAEIKFANFKAEMLNRPVIGAKNVEFAIEGLLDRYAGLDWALALSPGDIWSDDIKDPDYNMLGKWPSDYRHERLIRPDPLYDIILLTNWNWPYPVKGRGSAIFLHQWRKPGHPTEGCIAFDRQDLLDIVKRITFGTKIIVLPHRHARQK